MPGRRAGSGVGKYKTGQQKGQMKSKTKHFAHLGMLFIYVWRAGLGQGSLTGLLLNFTSVLVLSDGHMNITCYSNEAMGKTKE